MQKPLQCLVIFVAIVTAVASNGQQTAPADQRILNIEKSVGAVVKEQTPIERMPGANGRTAQEKLLLQLAEEVIFLHRENATLRKEIEQLKQKK